MSEYHFKFRPSPLDRLEEETIEAPSAAEALADFALQHRFEDVQIFEFWRGVERENVKDCFHGGRIDYEIPTAIREDGSISFRNHKAVTLEPTNPQCLTNP